MEKISLKNRKGQEIVGILEIPRESPIGTAIIQHGYGGFKEQDHVIAMKDAFLNNRFITFNFDATNAFGESDGEYERANLQLHYEDFEDVVAWAEKQPWFVGPIAITGHSMGGYSVARYAEEYPNKVSLCAPIAPLVSGELSWEAREKFAPGELEKWKQEGVLIKPSTTNPKNIKRSPWSHMEERLRHNLLPNANKLLIPVFLYVGSNDTSIPPEHVKILFEAIPGKKKTIVVAEGAGHTYRSKKEIEHLYKNLDEWIKSNT